MADGALCEAAFAAFCAHVGGALAHRVEMCTLAALCATSRAARAACRRGARCRAAAVRAATRALAANAAICWLLRPRAALDDFIRAALYDSTGVKAAEIKLARVMCAPAMQLALPPGAVVMHPRMHPPALRLRDELSGGCYALALWRCGAPDAAGVPRQALRPQLLGASEAAAELQRLFAAGFRPLRRRGWYNAVAGEPPLWARP
jgi:hypothetical protein